jgi:hypothetical protein
VVGIFGADSAAWTEAVHLSRPCLLNLGPLISHGFAPGEYQKALDTLISRQPGRLNVVLLHEGDEK